MPITKTALIEASCYMELMTHLLDRATYTARAVLSVLRYMQLVVVSVLGVSVALSIENLAGKIASHPDQRQLFDRLSL